MRSDCTSTEYWVAADCAQVAGSREVQLQLGSEPHWQRPACCASALCGALIFPKALIYIKAIQRATFTLI